MTSDMLQNLHPTLARWFKHSFNQPTDVQAQAWASIFAGRHTLIAAPTGSGKTLAAIIPGINRIIEAKLQAGKGYRSGVRLLYITPLKALNNDIHLNVIRFAEELEQLAAETQLTDSAENLPETRWPGLNVAVRTGDTPQSTRASIID